MVKNTPGYHVCVVFFQHIIHWIIISLIFTVFCMFTLFYIVNIYLGLAHLGSTHFMFITDIFDTDIVSTLDTDIRIYCSSMWVVSGMRYRYNLCYDSLHRVGGHQSY